MFRIQIDTLQPGAISRSSTIGEGIYKGIINSTDGTFKLTPQSDFNVPPTALGLPASPIGIKTAGGRVSLGPRTLTYAAAEGKVGSLTAKGRATLIYDVGVVFRVVQDPGTSPRQNVSLLATGIMDGFTNVVPNSLVPGIPEATLDARIEIPGLDKVVASSSATGSATVTHGITVTTDPSASIGPQVSKQVTNAGNKPVSFQMLRLVPVNQPLVCHIALSLMAAADALEIPIAGPALREAASAVLTTQYVFLIPDPPGTALVSSTTAAVSIGLGGAVLALVHPLTSLGVVNAAEGHADGAIVESGLSVVYTGFRPEVEAVLFNGSAAPADPLRGTLIGYPMMSFSGIAPDGAVLLTGGALTFTDAASGATMATANLSNVRASVSTQTLTGSVSGFTAVGFPLAASPIATGLNQRGGTLTFWTDAVAAVQNAVGLEPSGPGSVVLIVPNP